ncbi:hypothetical protein A8C56_09610 [Niabella ginsenosidivorans]|uniref:Glycosyl hydrolases family 2 sugar binding domain-containing protein n=1 Tax=Niabella ginsenosidivorans TaxID=1176587 RepID=A0A1A9I3Q6_9BACT|nr:glycosyl hydrolase [Niabella ginsenosidivorans]ANH81204.1 hypothetical protein A8C56_09610 [Niabella ginsenosidivorans]
MRKISYLLIFVCFSAVNTILAQDYPPETLRSLAGKFSDPPIEYRPNAWWHWMGSNFSKEGVVKDLHAMKEAGVGGVIIFNAPSWLDTAMNPWPQQHYRSKAYWEALELALSEAKSLNMTVGIHNSPGWSTTGGPWIKPEQGMQEAGFSTTIIEGNQKLNVTLPKPKMNEVAAPYYKEVAVMAVPLRKGVAAGDVLDISDQFSNDRLNWAAPAGKWKIYRFGYYPSLIHTHPVPEDVEATSLEADKMNPEATIAHWKNVLNPLEERLGQYIGNTFNIIWVDSYEARDQNWSSNFRNDFIKVKGYDPVVQVILAYERGDSIFNEEMHGIHPAGEKFSSQTNRFLSDYKEVINRLFLQCFQLGKDMVNKAGFQFAWEPYGSIWEAPFDRTEGIGIADIPATEFWVHSTEPSGEGSFATAAAKNDHRIVAAEAFTGMEAACRFTETPAMLKRPADMGFSYGINKFFLHSWAHNPLSDAYQPGWSFAHYGTHFSRTQTWLEPGKAFFTYLARCQMLLQQGTFIVRTANVLQRSTPEAEIFFVRNTNEATEKTIAFPVKNAVPELWDAYRGIIQQTNQWKQQGDSTFVTIKLDKDQSMFIVFPAQKTTYFKQPEVAVLNEEPVALKDRWIITFHPKTNEKTFTRKWNKLVDFSKEHNKAVQYFSGTAVYEQTITIKKEDLASDKRILIDLGTVYDMAGLEINGKKAGILWSPPFKADITRLLKAGKNTVKIAVTNTWVNRLIGDEQYPADFEWTMLENNGTPAMNGLPRMKGLPEWATNGQPRPSKERKTFIPWSYFNKNSPLVPAGLLGPVTLRYQQLKVN